MHGQYNVFIIIILGHTKNISIPDCIKFEVTTNVCRGYCESWSLPSIIFGFKRHPVTSLGQCCNMMETKDVSNILPGNTNVVTLLKNGFLYMCHHIIVVVF